MLSVIEVFWAVQAAGLALTAVLLMEPGHVLNPYYNWLERKSILGWPDYITKPLGMCARCFVGQVGFWFGVFLVGLPVKTLLFASIAILINETKEWLQR